MLIEPTEYDEVSIDKDIARLSNVNALDVTQIYRMTPAIRHIHVVNKLAICISYKAS